MYLRIFDVSQVPINLTHTHRKTKAANSGFFVLWCVAPSFSLLRKRAHYHKLSGPPEPLSPSGFAPNVLLFCVIYTESNFKKVPK